VLPQLERAVVEFRGGNGTTTGTSNRTYGVHTPNAATGTPESVGGTGVFAALTNAGTINADTSTVSTTRQINVPWTNFQQLATGNDLPTQPPAVKFSIARAGNTLTVKIGDQTSTDQWDHIWSATSIGFADINAIQLRMAAGGTSTWRITNLLYNNQALTPTVGGVPTTTYQADNLDSTTAFTAREIFLWDKVAGDFTLAGDIFLGWYNTYPTNSTANLQFKLLDLPGLGPDPIPEPSSWAMLITGFGLVGATLRRRRAAIA
jgi:hypothetical protein